MKSMQRRGVLLYDHAHSPGGVVIKGSTLTADDHSLVRTPSLSSAATEQLNSKFTKGMEMEYTGSSGITVNDGVLSERGRMALFCTP